MICEKKAARQTTVLRNSIRAGSSDCLCSHAVAEQKSHYVILRPALLFDTGGESFRSCLTISAMCAMESDFY